MPVRTADNGGSPKHLPLISHGTVAEQVTMA